ncbi:hypothetical protein T552_04062 [Pneumocystis carinii B80]|uniref:Anaphase-promoting complex subunit 4 WD40 domain-containing protein n=1 Tax=Pneumocystis carinii (strain B80) TaxID=1408658 RepID=A0A0W4ZTD7_PNEC8|nr:hypothetical protein T552_04062 [Pneumocystis carinii B80]KTW31641.1 hypothetical protein T552_04062 [Pneumocystis carinii B80]
MSNLELENNKWVKLLGFHGPVTSVLFLNKSILFAGQGPYIKIYDVKNGMVIYRAKVFKKNRIHGIVYAKENTLIIWGGKDFCIVKLNELFNKDDFDINQALDWIFDAKLSYDKLYILLATAHNKVYVYDIERKEYIQTFSCIENPLLYSSCLYIYCDGSITVVSGTIFNEICVWSINSVEIVKKKDIMIQITHRLKGHEGIVFKINFSKNGKLFCTCSDDRSVRIWDINSGECKAIGWGHDSRIWDVKFIGNEESKLISVSEDTTARLWKITSGSKLEQDSVYDGHEGKNVWCVSVFGNMFATGGSDGKIRLWEINDKTKPEYYITPYDIRNVTNSFNKLYDVPIFDLLIVYNTMIIFFRKVLIHDTKTKKSNYLFYDLDLSGFSKISLWSETDFVNISDKLGNIYLLNIKNKLSTSKYHISNEKIQSLFPISFKDSLYLITVSAISLRIHLHLFKYIESSFIYEKKDIISIAPMELTAAAIDFKTNLIFLGFKTGLLSIHRLESFGEGLSSIYLVDDLYKKNALSTIIIHSHEETLFNKRLEITTIGRDWIYYILELTIYNGDDNDSKITVEKRHQGKCSKHGIEGGFYLKEDLILYGFKKLRFSVWNQSKGFRIFSVVCGGSHRHWSIYFSCSENKENSTFIFTRSNSIIICNFLLLFPFQNFQKTILQDGRHGREIRSMAFYPISYQRNTLLFLTGAEDTTLRLSKLYITNCSEIINIYCEKEHDTGIEKISWSKNGLFFFSCGGAEEFVAWKFSIKDLNHVRIIRHAICPAINKRKNVRIMDFSVIEFSNKDNYLIIMACSDSSIRIWSFLSKTSEYILLLNKKYSTKCPLNVTYILEKEYCYLLVTSTDGFITLWDISNYIHSSEIIMKNSEESFLPIWKDQIHQSNIKSMTLRHIEENTYLLVTGGDDNKINILKITIKLDSNLSNYKISCKTIMNKLDAHNSSITGLAFSVSGLLFSVAADQRLKIWKINTSELLYLAEFYTYIADPCGISIAKILNKEILTIYGIGLEFFSFDYTSFI